MQLKADAGVGARMQPRRGLRNGDGHDTPSEQTGGSECTRREHRCIRQVYTTYLPRRTKPSLVTANQTDLLQTKLLRAHSLPCLFAGGPTLKRLLASWGWRYQKDSEGGTQNASVQT